MNKKKLYITLFALSIIFLGIGGTFAYLTVSINATNITQIKSGNLTMTIDGGGNENVTLFPATCTSDYAIKKTIKASAKNTSGGKVSFSIGMNVATLGADLKRTTMKYALSTSATSCTDGLVASGNFKDATVGSDIWLIKNDYDDITNTSNTYTKTYYLYIWLDQSETQNLSGSISVNMKGTSSNNPNLTTEASIDESSTLYYEVISKANTTTAIDFSQTSESSNTNGVYMTTDTDSGNPVYYYRGDVNNRVKFANFCWRIIRTTETGGVKLIYDGEPSNGHCNNYGSSTIISESVFNSDTEAPAFTGYMYGTAYPDKYGNITTKTGTIIFGNDVTYTNGTYTLNDTYTLSDVSNWSTEQATISSKYHYTCFSSSNTCTTVNYIYYVTGNYISYYELSNGKKNIDVLKDMLDNSENTTNSTAKTAIDNWYKENMTDYTSKLEDTVFCNDRSYDISTSGWNKDYSNTTGDSYFNVYKRTLDTYKPTLVCQNNNDKFTVNTNNGNGALTYPVGLMTVDEMVYAGGVFDAYNYSYYLYNSTSNWSLSTFVTNAEPLLQAFLLSSSTITMNIGNNFDVGVRPVVSLKPGTIFSGGDGTAGDPYTIGTYVKPDPIDPTDPS